MDRTKFSRKSPGDLVPIGGEEVAFRPHPLPPRDLELDRTTLQDLSLAREALGELRGVIGPGVLEESVALALGWAILIAEARGSSSIEGITAEPEELVAAQGSERAGALSAGADSAVSEVLNYAEALQQGDRASTEMGLSLWVVRRMHQSLMAGVRGAEKSPGEFRNIQVYIGADHRFTPPPGGDTVIQMMEDLERYWQGPTDSHDPLVRAFLVHYQFETIHPFRDGNGRTGRALLSLMCASAGRLGRPWLHLSEYFETHREEYYRLLFEVSASGAWDAWVRYCCRATASQAATTVERCLRLMELRRRWESALPLKLRRGCLKILDRLLALKPVTVAQAQADVGVAYGTAKKYLEEMSRVGIASRLKLPVATYFSSEAMQIVYGKSGR